MQVVITEWFKDIDTPLNINQWTNWMIYRTEGNEQELIYQVKIKRAKVMIVSNGLYHPEYQKGTSAWIITTQSS